jgi:putative endonuclease
MNTRKTGADGEEKAADYLTKNGYEIVERNVHIGKFGEIDIVAKENDGTFVFIEVKYNRVRSSYGKPEFRCDARKMKQLIRLVKMYIYGKKLHNTPVRIDVIAIDGDGLRHYKNCIVM